jgi:farnesyl diphosphate synthase
VRNELLAGLARAAGPAGMVGGQSLDLEAEKLGVPQRPGLVHIARLQAMKTAALFGYACEAGAILGRAEAASRTRLVQFGERMGLAFQIADDLLDLEGEPALLGKATGKDEGKATLVAALGGEGARARLGSLEAEAIALLAPFGAKADILCEAARFVGQRRS